jgi:hypothetical protein
MEEKIFFMKTLLKLGDLTVHTEHVPDIKLTSRLIVLEMDLVTVTLKGLSSWT